MIKKKIIIPLMKLCKKFCFLFVFLFFVSACQSTMRMSTWVPSTSGISGYKTVAVRSTQQYKGSLKSFGKYVNIKANPNAYDIPSEIIYFTSSAGTLTKSAVASNAGSMIERALNQGVYTVYGTKTTDELIANTQSSLGSVRDTLLSKGIELLVTSSIDSLDYDEYITVEEVKKSGEIVGYRYYLNQEASVSLSLMVQDVEKLTVLWKNTYSVGKTKNTKSSRTLIGTVDSEGVFVWANKSAYKDVSALFKDLVNSLYDDIRDALTPHKVATDFSLMKNKGKIKALDKAYQLANEGYYSIALNVFLDYWEETGYEPAGYNAVLMYYGTGQYNQAAELANVVYMMTGSPDALVLVQKMQNLLTKQQSAFDQMNGQKSGATAVKDLIL